MASSGERQGGPRRAVRNVEEVAALEAEAERGRRVSDRAADAIVAIVGTIGFVLAHLLLFAGWAAVNGGMVPGVPAFDPYPFNLLTMIVSMEGVLLATFVLIKQNRMSARADERAHLDLQVSLLAEQEVTKVIQMLERISREMGIENRVTDAETRDLGETTAVGVLAQRLRDRMPDRE